MTSQFTNGPGSNCHGSLLKNCGKGKLSTEVTHIGWNNYYIVLQELKRNSDCSLKKVYPVLLLFLNSRSLSLPVY